MKGYEQLDSTLDTLQKALKYRELGGFSDRQFVAVAARLADPEVRREDLPAKHDLSVDDVWWADEFLRGPAGMLEDLQGMIEWHEIRKAEEAAEKEHAESFQDWLDDEFNKRSFAFRYRVPTVRQSEQIASASAGDRRLVEDILDIAEQKVLKGDWVKSPVGFVLTVLKQPKEKIHTEANEARLNGKQRPTVNREPIFPEDDHPAA